MPREVIWLISTLSVSRRLPGQLTSARPGYSDHSRMLRQPCAGSQGRFKYCPGGPITNKSRAPPFQSASVRLPEHGAWPCPSGQRCRFVGSELEPYVAVAFCGRHSAYFYVDTVPVVRYWRKAPQHDAGTERYLTRFLVRQEYTANDEPRKLRVGSG
jgi:hypothetical protein